MARTEFAERQDGLIDAFPFCAGVPILVAHMFVFYFAVVSAITPPVALAVMAARPQLAITMRTRRVHRRNLHQCEPICIDAKTTKGVFAPFDLNVCVP